MIPKLICFVFGHIFKIKVYSGKTYDAGHNPISGLPQTGYYYDWRMLSSCNRCNCKLEAK